MFTCSICFDTFVESLRGDAYSTSCGHIYHKQCIMTWLRISPTCPHCRTQITRNRVKKLFLQIDFTPETKWVKNKEKEINSLVEQLELFCLRDKSQTESYIGIETQLKHFAIMNNHNNAIIHSYKQKLYGCEVYINKLKTKLETLEIEHDEEKNQNLMTNSQLQHEENLRIMLEKNIYEMKSVNSVIIDKLKREIADLKTINTYYQNTYQSLENETGLLPSTSKTVIENEQVTFPKIEVKKTFYANDPHLTLSPKQFLLGCVFFFLDDEFNLENIHDDLSLLKIDIIAHGGQIATNYSNQVSHLVCATQKHIIIEQALIDNKRCVTNYWISDVLVNKIISRPWLAYHFPTPYSRTIDMPCQEYQIAIANFGEHYSNIVKEMVKLIGGNVVDKISSTTDVLVSLNLEGKMVEEALAMNKPIVNVQWLNDILFGAKIDIHNPVLIKYQQFNLLDPFWIDLDMVSHLMKAWETPVVYLETLKVNDLTDSDDGPSKPKKQKVELTIRSPSVDLINDDNDDNVDKDDDCYVVSYVDSSDKLNTPYIVLCGFTIDEELKLKDIIARFGGIVTSGYKATHLVLKEPIISTKFLMCLSTVNHVVNRLWLELPDCSNAFQDEKLFGINDIYDESHSVVCNVPKVLNSFRQLLFRNLYFFVTPGIMSPPFDCLQKMIESAGGIVEYQLRSIRSAQNLVPNTYFIISCIEDLHLVDDFLVNNHAIYSSEFIINSILKQRLLMQYTIPRVLDY